jgi:hypothetical protein
MFGLLVYNISKEMFGFADRPPFYENITKEGVLL